MKKLVFLAALALAVSGCFSVMRIPTKQSWETVTDPITHETYETNVVYGTCPNYPMCIYPTMHLRYHLLAFAWKDAPSGYKWRRTVGPCAFLGSLIGLPGDFLVDTIYLPWDWDASDTVECGMCNEVINPPVTNTAPAKKNYIISIRQEGDTLKVDTGDCKVKTISVQ